MTDQLSLAFDDRHRGQRSNLAAATTGYRDDRGRVETAVAALARTGAAFTADSVHQLVTDASPDPYDRNLVSSILGVWAQDGRIVEDRSRRAVRSSARSRHGSRNKWWRGANPRASKAA